MKKSANIVNTAAMPAAALEKPGIGVIMYTTDFFDSLLNCIKGTDKK